mmetsp:Transcript_4054/g.11458  ORF Transcript_4054/g.11458 Transcript_4054/m.11458 type:complete len:372 (-) Transcript_4054:690-1805(-)
MQLRPHLWITQINAHRLGQRYGLGIHAVRVEGLALLLGLVLPHGLRLFRAVQPTTSGKHVAKRRRVLVVLLLELVNACLVEALYIGVVGLDLERLLQVLHGQLQHVGRVLGLKHLSPSVQSLHAVLVKGQCFVACVLALFPVLHFDETGSDVYIALDDGVDCLSTFVVREVFCLVDELDVLGGPPLASLEPKEDPERVGVHTDRGLVRALAEELVGLLPPCSRLGNPSLKVLLPDSAEVALLRASAPHPRGRHLPLPATRVCLQLCTLHLRCLLQGVVQPLLRGWDALLVELCRGLCALPNLLWCWLLCRSGSRWLPVGRLGFRLLDRGLHNLLLSLLNDNILPLPDILSLPRLVGPLQQLLLPLLQLTWL